MRQLQALLGLALLLAASVSNAHGAEPTKYELPDESRQRKDDVPRGKVESFEFADSKVFPGTRRTVWVYQPAQYNPAEPCRLMVFQDGHAYVGEEGQFRVPVVFDNLMASSELPPIVGVFINPGHKGDAIPKDAWKSSNRSVEYDTLSDDYAKFLIDDLLPVIEQKTPVSHDPDQRAICGISSGGICAFTVAWERPDSFRKVLSHVGSFTNIRGGHVYPSLVRKTDPKPLRVALQANQFDLDNQFGNWFLANQEMAAALKFRGYDYQLENGLGEHNGEFGGSILPAQLRWLWRDEHKTSAETTSSK